MTEIQFEFDPEMLASIKEGLGVSEDAPLPASLDEVASSEQTNTTRVSPAPAISRRRGRPKGSLNKKTLARIRREASGGVQSEDDGEEAEGVPVVKQPLVDLLPKLTKRDERQVADRLSNILLGATGIGGMAKPYIPMTDEEAKAIAEPLASYLIRNEDLSPVAREILENYDLVAVTLGVAAYTVRVYNDRRDELATIRSRNGTLAQRVSPSETRVDGRGQDEGDSAKLSVAPFTGSQPYTPDL